MLSWPGVEPRNDRCLALRKASFSPPRPRGRRAFPHALSLPLRYDRDYLRMNYYLYFTVCATPAEGTRRAAKGAPIGGERTRMSGSMARVGSAERPPRHGVQIRAGKAPTPTIRNTTTALLAKSGCCRM